MIRITIAGFSRVQTQLIDAKTQDFVKNEKVLDSATYLFYMIRITITGFSRVQTQLIDAKTQVFVKNEKIMGSVYGA